MSTPHQPGPATGEQPADPWAPQPGDDPWAPQSTRRSRRARSAEPAGTPHGPQPSTPSRNPQPPAPGRGAGQTMGAPATPAREAARPAGAPASYASAPGTRPAGGTVAGPLSGVGAPLEGDRRRLARVAATGGGLGRVLRSMFTADRTPADMAAHASRAQSPVLTGRRIAVVSTRGGAGKTTAAAVLGRLFSAVRPDSTAVLDLDPGRGSLAVRLGVDGAAPIDALVPHATGGRLPAADELSAMFGHAAPNLFATGPRGPRPHPAGAPALRETCTAVSRYFPVTLLDCPTGLDAPATQAGLADAHGALFVVPATFSGMDDALAQLAHWVADPLLAPIPLTVLVMQQDKASALDALDQAARLSRLGFDAHALGYDRHLAAGADVSLPLLAAPHRVAATALAGRLLGRANGEEGA